MPTKILSVDDSKTIRMIVKKAFKPFDCVVFEAENGLEGLAVAAKEKPDLIVLDITMPIMTGVEMLEKLRADEALKNVPVIMLTAESGKESVLKIVKMGVKDYIVKPFKGEQLIERAMNLITLKGSEGGEAAQESEKNFHKTEGTFQIISVSAVANRAVIAEMEMDLQSKIGDMSRAGFNKCILDLTELPSMNVSIVKFIIFVMEKCRLSNAVFKIAGSRSLAAELKEFQETNTVPVLPSVEEAKASY